MSNIILAQEEKSMLEKVRILFPTLKNVSDTEIAKAISVSRYLGLDPLRKEVHFVPYGGSIQLVTAYTEYIKRAERSGKLNGWEVIFNRDDFGEFAEITIHRKDWAYPFKHRVYMEEARQNTNVWHKMPKFMLRKVCIAQGFRLCFPEETAELPYEEAEIGYNQSEVHSESLESVIEPVIEETRQSQSEPATEKQIKAIKAIATKKGVDEKAIIAKYGLSSTKELTREQASEVIEELQKLTGVF